MVFDNSKSLRDSDNQSDVYLNTMSSIRNGGLLKPREICYEVIKSLEGVTDCLRLRYTTYRYVNFIEENKDNLDIDPYDTYSTYLGAYDVTGEKKVLIGTLRIIDGYEKSNTSPFVEELIRTARDPRLQAINEHPKIFPIMESFDIPGSYLTYFNSKKTNANDNTLFHPYELSRLTIRPDYWLHNIDVGLHHMLVLDSWLHNPPRNDFLIAVHPRSRRRYERIGFKIIPGTNEVLYKHIAQLAIAMVLDLEQYLKRPQSYRTICESLLPFYKEHGYFSRVRERRKTIKN